MEGYAYLAVSRAKRAVVFGSLAVLGLSGVYSSAMAAETSDRVMIIFDSSGSMARPMGRSSKMGVAQRVMRQAVRRWDRDDVHLGLMAYGHRSKDYCGDIETLISWGPVQPGKITRALRRLQPRGKTPIAEALRRAADELNYRDEKATVVLISDGRENCARDPCAAARSLARSGADFTAHVIGFGVSGRGRRQLQCVARATGGRFVSADNAGELLDALNLVNLPEPNPVIGRAELRLSSLQAGTYELVVKLDESLNDGTQQMVGAWAQDRNSRTQVRLEGFVRQSASQLEPIRMAAADTTEIDAPASVASQSRFVVTWRGPNGPGDRVMLTRRGARRCTSPVQSIDTADYQDGRVGEFTFDAPRRRGVYELQYCSGDRRKAMARQTVRVVRATSAETKALDDTDREGEEVAALSRDEDDESGAEPSRLSALEEDDGDGGNDGKALTSDESDDRQGSDEPLIDVAREDDDDRGRASDVKALREDDDEGDGPLASAETGDSDEAIAGDAGDNTSDRVALSSDRDDERLVVRLEETDEPIPAEAMREDDGRALRRDDAEAVKSDDRIDAENGQAVVLEEEDFVTSTAASDDVGGPSVRATDSSDARAVEEERVEEAGSSSADDDEEKTAKVEADFQSDSDDEPLSTGSAAGDGADEAKRSERARDRDNDDFDISRDTAILAEEDVGEGSKEEKTTRTARLSLPDDDDVSMESTKTGSFIRGRYSWYRPITAEDEEENLARKARDRRRTSDEVRRSVTDLDQGDDFEEELDSSSDEEFAGGVIALEGRELVPAFEDDGDGRGSEDRAKLGDAARDPAVRANEARDRDPARTDSRRLIGEEDDESEDTTRVAMLPPIPSSMAGPKFARLDSVKAGFKFKVAWSSPARRKDWIAIARPDQTSDNYIALKATRASGDLELRAPSKPGPYELRYISSRDGRVISRQSFQVDKGGVKLVSNGFAESGDQVWVWWSGPGDSSDLVTLAREKMDDDNYLISRPIVDGNPIIFEAPQRVGSYEIRYVNGTENVVMCRRKLVITEPQTLSGTP